MVREAGHTRWRRQRGHYGRLLGRRRPRARGGHLPGIRWYHNRVRHRGGSRAHVATGRARGQTRVRSPAAPAARGLAAGDAAIARVGGQPADGVLAHEANAGGLVSGNRQASRGVFGGRGGERYAPAFHRARGVGHRLRPRVRGRGRPGRRKGRARRASGRQDRRGRRRQGREGGHRGRGGAPVPNLRRRVALRRNLGRRGHRVERGRGVRAVEGVPRRRGWMRRERAGRRGEDRLGGSRRKNNSVGRRG